MFKIVPNEIVAPEHTACCFIHTGKKLKKKCCKKFQKKGKDHCKKCPVQA